MENRSMVNFANSPLTTLPRQCLLVLLLWSLGIGTHLAASPTAAVDPTTYMYIGGFSRSHNGGILQLRQRSNGSLVALNPQFIGAGPTELEVVTHPNGHLLYESNSTRTDGIFEFRIGANGLLRRVGHVVDSNEGYSAMAITPSSKYLYALSDDDRIWAYSIGLTGRLSLLQQVTIDPEHDASSIAIDSTGHYLYAVIRYRSANSDFDPFIRRFTIGESGHLKTDRAAIYNDGVFEFLSDLITDTSKPYLYLITGKGISPYHIAQDGSLKYIKSQDADLYKVSLNKMIIDGPYDLLFGLASRNLEGHQTVEIDVWHRNMDGSLSRPLCGQMDRDGRLHDANELIPSAKAPTVTTFAVDTRKQFLYVPEYQTSRILRYSILPDGQLQLSGPGQSFGIKIGLPEANAFVVVNPAAR